jgi:S-adenosyl methyltransferase
VTEHALAGPRVPEPAIDPYVAHTAWVVDHLLGGVTNFEADRRAAQAEADALGGMEVARASACGVRVFVRHVVGYLAGPAGVRQFLDVGTGVPRPGGVHLVARAAVPDARVVFVDADPIVLAHAHQLVGSGPPGATAYLHCDVRHPEEILDRAAATLDLDEPVAVVLSAVLHHLPDRDDPHTVVKRPVGPLAPGSHLAVSHLTG